MQDIKQATATDSAYVFSGLQGTPLRWRANGWVTVHGPVTNVDLWIELMDLIDRSVALVEWIKVPSHIGISTHNRADQLAEEGRKAYPLYSAACGRVPGPMTPLHLRPPRDHESEWMIRGLRSPPCAVVIIALPLHCVPDGVNSTHRTSK